MTIPSKVNIERYVLLEEQLRINNIHNGPSLYINQTSNENVVDIQQNNNSFFYIENNGNVGIGTNNPNSKLHVNGIITGNGSQITNLNYDNITNQPAIDNVSDSNFDLKLSNKTTTNLIEGSNLYYTDERVEQHILSKNLISLTNCNLNNNELLYYTGESWCNLKIDETTLEITTDNKLKVIGGGGGTQVLIQNESDTITSNLEKPIIDSSNLVTDGLIAHYKFDGDLTDSSGNNHNLSSIGTIEYDTSTYIYGKSSYLSGDDYFQSPSSLNPYNIWNGNGITISGWFKLKSTSVDWATLFEINQDGSNTITVGKNYTANTLWYGKNNNEDYTNSTTYNVTVFDDTWHHIVMTIDISGNAILYVDNVANTTLANITLTPSYTNFNISYSA